MSLKLYTYAKCSTVPECGQVAAGARGWFCRASDSRNAAECRRAAPDAGHLWRV